MTLSLLFYPYFDGNSWLSRLEIMDEVVSFQAPK